MGLRTFHFQLKKCVVPVRHCLYKFGVLHGTLKQIHPFPRLFLPDFYFCFEKLTDNDLAIGWHRNFFWAKSEAFWLVRLSFSVNPSINLETPATAAIVDRLECEILVKNAEAP